ncbi:MAG TPA: hypothetical protein VH112_00510 [Acidimicrobiales bacterium]|jgi:hypothetical protein|nr:hypothetical protein [Acidimicrobiales bacterium]
MSDHRDEGSAEDPSEDSEIDFDDEQEDDQSPLDEAEAAELGVDLDDPEELSETEDDV